MVSVLMRKLATTAVANVVMVSAFGCSPVSSGKWIIRVFHAQSETHPKHPGMLVFKECVEEHLGDKYEMQISPNKILGSVQKTIELTQTGAISFVVADTTNLETFVDVYKVFNVPYLFDSGEVHRSVIEDTDYMEDIYKSADETGFRVVTQYNAGARSFYAETPISTSDNLKGKKIRIQQSPTNVDIVNAFGAATAPMGFGEVHTVTRQSVIDDAENNELALTSNKHGEVAKYYTYNRRQTIPDVLVINLKSLNSLRPEGLQVLKEAAALSTGMESVEWNKSIKEAKQIAVHDMGVTFAETDVEVFKAKVLPLYQKMLENNPKVRDFYQYIQTVNDSRKGDH